MEEEEEKAEGVGPQQEEVERGRPQEEVVWTEEDVYLPCCKARPDHQRAPPHQSHLFFCDHPPHPCMYALQLRRTTQGRRRIQFDSGAELEVSGLHTLHTPSSASASFTLPLVHRMPGH